MGHDQKTLGFIGPITIGVSAVKRLDLVVLHCRVTRRLVKPHKPTDFYVRQHPAAHQVVDVPHAAAEMLGDLLFAYPLDRWQGCCRERML